MDNQPLVSILITTYNREHYIAEAIESVLSSTYQEFELIIVDDLSTDNTAEIARQFAARDPRIKVYVNEKNLGDYPNRNKAAEYAVGKYIKYLDADDILYDFGIEIMVRYTERFPEAGFGLGAYPDDDHPFPILLSPREIYLESLVGKYSHFDRAPGSGFIKTEVFRQVGGFSGKRMIGDYEFWFKISRYFSMVKLPLDLYWNRLHPGQESQSEYAKKNYDRLREEVFNEAMNHRDCPLSKEEISSIKLSAEQFRRKEKLITKLSKIKRLITGNPKK